jgi:hypothetical protein
MKSVCLKRISELLNNNLSYTPLNIVDFGCEYREALAAKNLSLAEIESIKENCSAFILTLYRELSKRLPANMEAINSIKFFSSEFCFKLLN